jgi:hypothetical protein
MYLRITLIIMSAMHSRIINMQQLIVCPGKITPPYLPSGTANSALFCPHFALKLPIASYLSFFSAASVQPIATWVYFSNAG